MNFANSITFLRAVSSINGTIPARLATIATIAAAPAAPDIDRAVRPTEKASTPAPARSIPAPISVTAAPNASSVGTTGVRIRPARPMTVKAPAKVTRPLAISSHDNCANMDMTGARMAREPATTNRAAAPGRAPTMTSIATAIMVSAPARTVMPLAISSQLILLILRRASPMISMAPATIRTPAAETGAHGGMRISAAEMRVKAPARTVKPRPISPQLIPPMVSSASASIPRAAAATNTPAADRGAVGGIRVSAAPRSTKPPAVAVRPLPISSQDSVAKSSIALARILMPEARRTIPAPESTPPLSTAANLVNNPRPARTAPTPTRPLVISSHDRPERSVTALARILMPTARIVKPAAVDIIPAEGGRNLPTAITPARRAVTPVRPLARSFQFSSASSLTEEAKIRIATPMTTMAPAMAYI